MYLSYRTSTLNFYVAVQRINISIFPAPLLSFNQTKSGMQMHLLIHLYSTEPNEVRSAMLFISIRRETFPIMGSFAKGVLKKVDLVI